MLRAYSVMQIQFECLSYIKEFGATPGAWTIATCDDPEPFLRRRLDADGDGRPWLTKPALTPRAARAVVDRLRDRYGLQPERCLANENGGRHVVILRREPIRGDDGTTRLPRRTDSG